MMPKSLRTICELALINYSHATILLATAESQEAHKSCRFVERPKSATLACLWS